MMVKKNLAPSLGAPHESKAPGGSDAAERFRTD
jgi:hypothetical protein